MRWTDRPLLPSEAKKGLFMLICIVLLATAGGVWIGRAQRPAPTAPPSLLPLVYLISVSRVDTYGPEEWYVQYSIDGRYEGVPIPIKPGEPDGYLAYLHSLGRMGN